MMEKRITTTRSNPLVRFLRGKKDYLYVLPAAFFVTAFFVSSIIYSVRLSFMSWDGFGEETFVGLQNYLVIFLDPNLRISLMNTFIWVTFSMLISLILPMVFALLIVNSSAGGFFKNAFYFPSTLSSIVAGIIMSAMFSKYGLPQIFGLLGLKKWVVDWLAVPYLNTFIMIIMGAWRGIGTSTLLFIAALRGIDRSPMESAQIDGATGFTLFRRIILHLIKPTTVVVMLMSIVNNFKQFDSIWVMTKGGPYRSSETLALSMYVETFMRSNYGGGAAVAVVLTIMVLIVSYYNLRNTFSHKDDLGA